MISKNDPLGWAAFMYELEDAQEHLAGLISHVSRDPDYDEADLRVELGHIYSHLNRAWNGRNSKEGLSGKDYDIACEFPNDIEPT